MKKIILLLAIWILAIPVLSQTTVTPNIGLQNPAYGSTNWQVPWYYNTALLDNLLSGNGSLSNLLVSWSSTVTYPAGVIITYNGIAYESLQASNLNHEPDTSSAYWGKLSTTGNTNVNGSGTPGTLAMWTGSNVLGNATADAISAAGGIVNPMTGLGDMITGGTSGTPTRLAGNTTTTRNFLAQTGTGTASAAPVWTAITTDLVPEGSTNQYFTAGRVLVTPLTGYASTTGTITSSDTLLSGIEKLNGNQSNYIPNTSTFTSPILQTSTPWIAAKALGFAGPIINVISAPYNVTIGSTKDTGTDCATGSNCAALQSALNTGIPVYIPWDGNSGHCAHIAGTVIGAGTSTANGGKGQIITGANARLGGICEDQQNATAIQFVSTNGIARGVTVRDLHIQYTGPTASGHTASATITNPSGLTPSVSGPVWPTVTAMTVLTGGTNYGTTPGYGIIGCLGTTFLDTISSGVVTAVTPAYLAPQTGTSAWVGVTTTLPTTTPPTVGTGQCLWANNTNVWAASTAVGVGYVIIDSNNNFERVTTAGTTHSGSGPTWLYRRGQSVGDGTVVWQNKGPSNTWAASWAVPRMHDIVDASGYVWEATSANKLTLTTGTSTPAFTSNETSGSTLTDGGVTWTWVGKLGDVSVQGGSTGDPSGAAQTGYGLDFSAVNHAIVYGGSMVTVENVQIDGMGSGINITTWGMDGGNNTLSQQLQDGNGYCLRETGVYFNSDRTFKISCQGVGWAGFIGAGSASERTFGDLGGTIVSPSVWPVGKGLEIESAGELRFSTGNNELIGYPWIQLGGGSSVSLDTSYLNTVGGYFLSPISIIGATGASLSLDLNTMNDHAIDYSTPLVQQIGGSSDQLIVGHGGSTPWTDEFAHNTGVTMLEMKDGIVAQIQDVPTVSTAPTAIVDAAGSCVAIPAAYTVSGKKMCYFLDTSGAPQSVDLLHPQISELHITGTSSMGLFTYTSSYATGGQETPMASITDTATSGAGYPLLLSTEISGQNILIMRGPSGASAYNFNTSVAQFYEPIKMLPANTATSSTNYSGPTINFLGGGWSGSAAVQAGANLSLVMGTGSNPTETLTMSKVGSLSGALFVDFSAALGGFKAASFVSIGNNTTTDGGCANAGVSGSPTAGEFLSTASGTNTCTFTITMGSPATAPTGWICDIKNFTTPANVFNQTGTTATTATFTGTITLYDHIHFACLGY